MNSAVAVALPVVSQPTDTFRCERYKCTLTARACVIRQSGAGGPKARHGEVTRTTVTSWFNAYCASGECAQGAAVKRQLKGVEIEPPRKVDLHAQWAAKRRQAQQQSGGGEVKAERRTPPAPAAKASPPPIPTAPAAKEAAMADEKKKCPLDGKTLRADNTRGFCAGHINSQAGGAWRLDPQAYAIAQAKGIDVPEKHRPGRAAWAIEPRPTTHPKSLCPRCRPKAQPT